MSVGYDTLKSVEGSQLPFDDRFHFFAGVEAVKKSLAEGVRAGEMDEEAAAEIYGFWYGDAVYGEPDPTFENPKLN